MKVSRILVGSLAALLGLAGMPGRAEADRPVVKIGLIYPLSGAMSAFGEDMAKALPILQRRFNAQQSAYTFELSIEDGRFGQSNAAITAAHKLVDVEGVRFLAVGSSGEVLQIAPYVEAQHVLTVAGFASNPAIRSAGEYVFRTYIDIDNGIASVADDLRKKGSSRVAILTEESSFTSAVRDSLQHRLGGESVVFSENYSLGESDINSLIAKARAKSPQAYYLNTTTPANFIAILKQLRANGVRERVYTYYVPSLKEVQDALGEQLNGTAYLDFPETAGSSEDFNDFVTDFRAKYGTLPKAFFNFRTNYNAVKVLFDAIVAVGPDTGKAKEFLAAYDRPSATGRLRFDGDGDAMDLNLALKVYSAAAPRD